jgi:hypothetical protein
MRTNDPHMARMVGRAKRRALSAAFSAARRTAQLRDETRAKTWRDMQAMLKTNSVRIPGSPITPKDWAKFYGGPLFDDHRALMDRAMYSVFKSGFAMLVRSPFSIGAISCDLAASDSLDALAREHYDRSEACAPAHSPQPGATWRLSDYSTY